MKKDNKKKNKNKVLKRVIIILITIILCVGFGFGTYYITEEIDKRGKGGEVKVEVTFDDTETYVIPNVSKLNEEEAMKEWPYIFKIENSGDAKGLYQMHLKDMEDCNIPRSALSYRLYKDDVKVAFGKLGDLKEDLLYTYEIDGETVQEFKLYIWVDEDVEEASNDEVELKYEYKLELTVIKDGGPGF